MGKSGLLKLGQQFRRVCVKVSVRHRRVGFSFLPQESLDVSAVFLEKSPRTIFRMTLEMHEQALLFLLHKQVNTSFGGFSQNRITARSQRTLPHFVPSRVREPHRPRRVL